LTGFFCCLWLLPEATAKSQSPAARKDKLPIVTTPYLGVFLGRMADGVFPVSSGNRKKSQIHPFDPVDPV
jgi:hypothetical protein